MGKKRILVAEDNPEVRRVLERMLTSSGYEVRSVESGDEAKAVFEIDQRFDLLLTDIVISGYGHEAIAEEGGLQPDDTRLSKPVDKATLLGRVNSALAGT